MSTKVITGKVRFSYVNIFKSRAFQAGQDAKYSVCRPGRHRLQVGRKEAREPEAPAP